MKKLFHISEILSVLQGRMLVLKDELVRPDGSIRPALITNQHGLAALVQQVSGSTIINPANPRQLDTALMWHLMPHVKRSLAAWFPELDKIEFPQDEMPRHSPEAAMEFIGNWVREVAANHGGEWHEIDEDPDIGYVHSVSLGGPRL